MHHQPAAFWILTDPREDFEAIHPGHIQVEQQNIGKRIIGAVAIAAFSVQISQHLHPVADGGQHPGPSSFLERVLEKKDVISIIFSKQDVQRLTCECHQTHYAFSSYTFKGRWTPQKAKFYRTVVPITNRRYGTVLKKGLPPLIAIHIVLIACTKSPRLIVPVSRPSGSRAGRRA